MPDRGGSRGPRSYYSVCDRLVREIPGAWKPDQYSNPENPQSHYDTTGPELWQQTDGRITHFVAGVGTGGTISGTGRYLKDVSDGHVQVIGADPEGSVYSGGTGRPYLVEGVGEDFWPSAYDPTVADEIVAVSDRDSFLMTRRLAREEGLLVGGSCGMAVVARCEVAARLGPDDVVVVLLPDGGRGYLVEDLQRRLDGGLRLPRRAPASSTVGDVLRAQGGPTARARPRPPERDCRARRSTSCASTAYRRCRSSRPSRRSWPAEVVGSVIERELLDGSSPDRPISPTRWSGTCPRPCRCRVRRAGVRGDPRPRKGRCVARARRGETERCLDATGSVGFPRLGMTRSVAVPRPVGMRDWAPPTRVVRRHGASAPRPEFTNRRSFAWRSTTMT